MEQENLEKNDLIETPRKRKLRQLILVQDSFIKTQKMQIRRLQKKTSRYQKKIANLKDILKNLNEKNFISADHVTQLENIGVTDLIQRYERNVSSGQSTNQKYPPALRIFATTLHFYSPKAYAYVRKKFQTALPHIRTIKKWYQSIDAQPGFTQESLKAIKLKTACTKHKLLCNLVLDEMAIRQHVEWDGKQMHGYVDISNSAEQGDCLPEAKEVLVFLVTAINGAWKIPVGYFLIDGVTGEQRSNLVRQCLELLEDTGIQVTSMTFDGCPANITMAKKLGCSFEVENLKSYFEHPVTRQPVHIFLDPCHMLKLLRNAFESYGCFMDASNRCIKWSHLKNLYDIQDKEKLHLANKLRKSHIFFKNQKMKVRLASQLFSNSVADALNFCCELQIAGFDDVEGTVEYLKTINNLFDVLNSRHMAQLHYKKPVCPGNKDKVFETLEKAKRCLTSIKLSDGTKAIITPRKTGFIGLLVCIESLKALYIQLIEKDQKLKYIPAYKISQDHLELMFGHIRSHGGCSTNPTARQFQAIYKKLLVKSELRDVDQGNCIALEEVSFLSCSSAVQNINLTIEPCKLHEGNDEDEMSLLYEQAVFDEEISILVQDVTEFSSQVVSYIAGFIVHRLLKLLKCDTCCSGLIADTINDKHLKLIKLKDKGGLIFPSSDVITICKRMEVIIKTYILSSNTTKILSKNIRQELMSKSLSHFLGMNLFEKINFHQFNQSPMNNHLIILIKAVMEKYVNIRLHYLTKNAIPKLSKRQVLNKYLHFTGQ